jgi:hypothetical protein
MHPLQSLKHDLRGCLKQVAKFVMPGLDPGIHVLRHQRERKTWMAGSSPAMTGNTKLDCFVANAPRNDGEG